MDFQPVYIYVRDVSVQLDGDSGRRRFPVLRLIITYVGGVKKTSRFLSITLAEEAVLISFPNRNYVGEKD